MDSLKRQKPHKPRDGGHASPAQVAELVLRNTDSPHVVIGPAVWQPSDGTASKRWYLTIAASETGRGFRCDQIILAPDNPQADRARIIGAFITRGPLIVHSMEDELDMANLCEALWPGPEIARLRRTIEAERMAP
jgi:hypothetical protein